mgnify:CR=1 FL=1
MERIRGQVARILNSRELVINRGSEHGVKHEMLFDVLNPGGEDIIDPETKETLGSIELAKIRLKIVSVQPKLSVASTYQTYDVNVGGSGGFSFASHFLDDLKPPKYVTKVQTFRTNEVTPQQIRENESFVKTGDPVVQVVKVKTEAAEQ